MGLSLTEAAAKKVKEVIEADGIPDSYIRINIKGGGCSGYNYDLFLDDKPLGEMDEEYIFFGIKVVTNEICLTYIDGTVIDYVEGLYGAGFKFKNPNAKTTCGCASSFSV